MHDFFSPDCNYCEHFMNCFQTDFVLEWGYCSLKKIPPQEELERIKEMVEKGDYRILLTQAEELGLFVPASIDCDQFEDMFPF